jgi:CubicO group peptidase (beta-lactamase class C family)
MIPFLIVCNCKTFSQENYKYRENESENKYRISSDELALGDKLEDLAKQLDFPGFSACVLSHDQIIWNKNYGYADIANGIPATTNTSYHCASLTKSFSSAVILQLQEDGLLDLNENVLPSLYSILKQYGIEINESVGEIKIKHLLSHTSDNPVGTYFRYDGDRFSLLSKIIFDATNCQLQDHILKILTLNNINNTVPVTYLSNYPEIKTLLARPYTYDSLGNMLIGNYATQFNAATGLISSVNDLASFIGKLDNQLIISEESMQLANMPFRFKTGNYSNYGIGWFVENFHDVKLIWNFGYGYCTSGMILKIPEFDLTFIILSNCDRLSKPFPIGLPQVSVLESQFALEFFKAFIVPRIYKDPIPDIDLEKTFSEIENEISRVHNQGIRELLSYELKSSWNISRITGDSNQQEKLFNVYSQSFLNEKVIKKNIPVELVNISEVNAKGLFTQKFELENNALIRINAIADGGYCNYFGMYDQVWIENNESNTEIWRMNAEHTECGGGHPRNRFADLILELEAGNYTVYFDNRQSPYNHFLNHWEAFPPDDLFWGIRIDFIQKL